MGEPSVHPETSEPILALADLVRELESSDYRDSAGVRAAHTSAFCAAKALVDLHAALNRPWWRT